MQPVALFDIDHTIIRRDSMLLFARYGMAKKPSTAIALLSMGLFTALARLKLVSLERAKAAFFHAIRHMDEDDLAVFYTSELEPLIYGEALAEMRRRKEEGCHILLVTASPVAYMKYFERMPEVDAVIGTTLVRNGDRYLNRIEGKNCKGEEKVLRIREYWRRAGIEPDPERSYAYSDSLSDLPMLELARHRYWINGRGRHPGVEVLQWRR
ncbi:HAD family hydrolase [Paenibacillus methanolicus]|uniref:HAD superfamily hydrolase (TIGR01490 family) n=1 Tax=Paenibacillus methanolicus TaxID=582686 RepID=A0A5S5C3B5_9BACL|nr:HAD family hydrolase [Paenibacillus methanolicus]TYP72463.1 HAD superfamily hydrolase (TIGR01490 family) [Paenibacillus methanolicus]